MLIFAYGSNMCSTRLQERVSSATFVSKGKLFSHTIKLHKESTDGSAKANSFRTNNQKDFILGIIFEIDNNEKSKLDVAEGLGKGYSEKNVPVFLTDNTTKNVQLYYADENTINDSLLPYSWYMDFIIIGAKDYEFPENYITALSNIETKEDKDIKRHKTNRSILARHISKK